MLNISASVLRQVSKKPVKVHTVMLTSSCDHLLLPKFPTYITNGNN